MLGEAFFISGVSTGSRGARAADVEDRLADTDVELTVRDAVDLEVIFEGDRLDLATLVGQRDELLRHSDSTIFEAVVLDPDSARVIGDDAVEHIRTGSLPLLGVT
ncbi:MAG: hypothetical protein H7288_12125 [Kineosporiaceae bacterium]|nr:hypothetical protein [Aeromicrobium sp.]